MTFFANRGMKICNAAAQMVACPATARVAFLFKFFREVEKEKMFK